MMRRALASNPSEHGFTMVVIAALFLAFSVIAAVIVERNTVVQQITRRDAAAAQLSRLANAILEYSVFNKSGSVLLYPCPAASDQNENTSAFGTKTAGCDSGIPSGTALSGSMIIGMVPVQALAQYGISFNDAFDPWNNRIMYAVNRKLTTGSPVLTTEQPNNPTITDSATSLAIASPDFILISYGRDGAGAIKRGSTSVSIACPTTGTPLRGQNCDGNTSFVIAPTNTTAAAGSTTYFDDILSYYRQ